MDAYCWKDKIEILWKGDLRAENYVRAIVEKLKYGIGGGNSMLVEEAPEPGVLYSKYAYTQSDVTLTERSMWAACQKIDTQIYDQ